MKKLSISILALLAVVFAVTSAFTSASKMVRDGVYVFVADPSQVPPPTGTSEDLWTVYSGDLTEHSFIGSSFTSLASVMYNQQLTFEEACSGSGETICAIELKFDEDTPDDVTSLTSSEYILGEIQ